MFLYYFTVNFYAWLAFIFAEGLRNCNFAIKTCPQLIFICYCLAVPVLVVALIYGAKLRFSEPGKVCSGDYLDLCAHCIPEDMPYALMVESGNLLMANVLMLIIFAVMFCSFCCGIAYGGCLPVRKQVAKVLKIETTNNVVRGEQVVNTDMIEL
jgi:hypothetical protein